MIDQIIQLLYNLLFLVTPLIMTKSTSELFEFNKILFIYGSTVLIMLFWFLKMIINKKIILKKTPLDIPIVLFFLSQLISTIFSIDLHVSIFGYYGRFNGGLLSITCYILLYYGLVSNMVNIQKLLRSIVFSSVFVIFWAIPGHFGHDLTCLIFTGKFNNACWDNATLAFKPELRAFSTLGQPNWLGAYLAVPFFIGLYYLLKNQISKVKNINWESYLTPIYLFLNFSMILFSRSRSAIGAVIVGLALFIICYSLFIKTNIKKMLIILFIITIIPILFFKTGEDKVDKYLTFKTYQSFFTKQSSSPAKDLSVSNTSQVSESFDIRKIVWEGAWKLAKTYPIFGTGVETFAYSYNFVRPVEHNLTSEWDYVYNKAHNEYFNFLATTGFFGLISYLFLIFYFIYYSLKISNFKFLISNQFQISKSKLQNNLTIEQSNNRTILVVCLLIAYLTILITNFFGFSTTTTQLFFFLIPAFVILGRSEMTTPESDSGQARMTIVQKIYIFISFSVTIYLLFSISVYYIADVNYSYGLKYSKVNDQQKAVEYFEKALKMRQEPVYMDRFSSSLAYLSALANAQKQTELVKQIANLSDSYNKKTLQSFPNNVFYWKTRAKNMYYFFQITSNENELLQGIEALKKARILSPSDPKIPYSISLYSSILFDLTKSNLDKESWKKLSIDEVNIALKLKPNFREAYLFKGQLLKKYGLIEEAKKVFEYMLKNFGAKDEEVLKELNGK